MNRIIALIYVLLFSTLSFSYQNHCQITFEGSEPTSKKYYFKIEKPKDFDASKFQYAIWKTLKDKGYELTDYDNADIIIQVNYISVANNMENHEYVKIGERTKEINMLGKTTNIQVPIWSHQSTGHYIVNAVCLDLKAFPKDYDENSIPIWHIFTPREKYNVEIEDIVLMNLCWFKMGENNLLFSSTKKTLFKQQRLIHIEQLASN